MADLAKLKELKELKEAGVLNSGEFEEQKKAVLNAVPQGQPVPVAPQQVQVGIPGQVAQAPNMQLEMMKVCWRSHCALKACLSAQSQSAFISVR